MSNNLNIEETIAKLKAIEESLNEDALDNDFNKQLNEMLSTLNFMDDKVNIISMLEVKIKKLHPNAVVPTYSKDGDAGMDLTATEIIKETVNDITYGTGLAMEIPKGYVGLIFPRSSIRKYELQLSNSVGVIDSGYRGEIQATFKKTPIEDYVEGNSVARIGSNRYFVGDRIAQIMIIPYPKVNFVLSDELSDTERGVGGFGSTGL